MESMICLIISSCEAALRINSSKMGARLQSRTAIRWVFEEKKVCAML